MVNWQLSLEIICCVVGLCCVGMGLFYLARGLFCLLRSTGNDDGQ